MNSRTNISAIGSQNDSPIDRLFPSGCGFEICQGRHPLAGAHLARAKVPVLKARVPGLVIQAGLVEHLSPARGAAGEPEPWHWVGLVPGRFGHAQVYRASELRQPIFLLGSG